MLPFMFIPAGLNLVKNVGNIIQQHNDIAEQEKKLQKDKEYQDLLLNERREKSYYDQLNYNQNLADDYRKAMSINANPDSILLARCGGIFPNRNRTNKYYSGNSLVNNSQNYYTRIAVGI